MLAIAFAELRQIFRNRAVLVTSMIMPIAACAFFIYAREGFGRASGAYLPAIIVFTIAAFSLYSTTVTTLAGRRQTLFLKRLRSTAASDAGILTGLVLPATVIAVVQVGIILAVYAAVSSAPDNVALLVVAVLATFVMMLALALATAGLTNSPEHAQVTTLPVALGVVVIASWVGLTGTADQTVLKRALPGGSATELIMNAWQGGVSLADSLVLLAPTFGWVIVAVAAAIRMFRWEPRR